jgi:hypothetical protein
MTGRFASLFARSGPPMGEPPPEVPPPGFGPPPSAEPVPPPPAPAPPPPRRPPPERERRYLVRLREIELRDIGGLAAEMARRDDWRYPLLHSRCAEVLALEERIHELDAMIAANAVAARGVAVATCQCGAPLIEGSHFCANCGRPTPETPPVATCSRCGQPLPAEANFCLVCGKAVAAEALEPADSALDDTVVEPNAERRTP